MIVRVGLLFLVAATVTCQSTKPRYLRSGGPVKIEQSENYIVGGVDAIDGEYPYVVSLQSTWGRHQCGGSLIAPNFIITAAHCKDTFTEVHIGRLNVSTDTAFSESFGVDKQFVHPEFDDEGFDHDLMLVKIRGASSIEPVLLNRRTSVPAPQNELITIGWGRTNATDPDSLSDTLQEGRSTYIDNVECAKFWGDQVSSDMLCMVDSGNGLPCTQDSGGPVLKPGVKRHVLVGVVTWGPIHCQGDYPRVNSRISDLLPWIDSILCDESDSSNCLARAAPASFSQPGGAGTTSGGRKRGRARTWTNPFGW